MASPFQKRKPKRFTVRERSDGTPMGRRERRAAEAQIRRNAKNPERTRRRAYKSAAKEFDHWVAHTLEGGDPGAVPDDVKQSGLLANNWTTRGDGYWEGGALGMALPLDQAWVSMVRAGAAETQTKEETA